MRSFTSILKTTSMGTIIAGGPVGYIDLLVKYPLATLEVTAIVSTTLAAMATTTLIVVWMANREARRIIEAGMRVTHPK